MSKFTILDLIDLDPGRPNALDLRCISGRKGLSREIYSTDINRPGMALTGFFDQFVGERIQIIGRGEYAYIETVPEEVLMPNLKALLDYDIPCFIFSYNLEPPEYFKKASEEAGIPLLGTPLETSPLSVRLLRALDDVFAPRQTLHAVFAEVDGMGVLIQGESGVGKSETALELLDRGHRLVADDSVLLKCLNGNTLWGQSANKLMGHHMEIRGLGIIDIAQLYGMNSVRDRKPVEMVFHLEEWDSSKNYDRLGTSGETITLLGVSIPMITLPVKPGRNIPIIIEAAVLNERLKAQGVHAARDFNKNLIQWIESENARNLWFDRFVNKRGNR
jgi:HPr kinase/phosphorylase